jgi:hypothetical protein
VLIVVGSAICQGMLQWVTSPVPSPNGERIRAVTAPMISSWLWAAIGSPQPCISLIDADSCCATTILTCGRCSRSSFYTQEPRRLRNAMAADGLAEVRFHFDNDGSGVLVRS